MILKDSGIHFLYITFHVIRLKAVQIVYNSAMYSVAVHISTLVVHCLLYIDFRLLISFIKRAGIYLQDRFLVENLFLYSVFQK